MLPFTQNPRLLDPRPLDTQTLDFYSSLIRLAATLQLLPSPIKTVANRPPHASIFLFRPQEDETEAERRILNAKKVQGASARKRKKQYESEEESEAVESGDEEAAVDSDEDGGAKQRKKQVVMSSDEDDE